MAARVTYRSVCYTVHLAAPRRTLGERTLPKTHSSTLSFYVTLTQYYSNKI